MLAPTWCRENLSSDCVTNAISNNSIRPKKYCLETQSAAAMGSILDAMSNRLKSTRLQSIRLQSNRLLVNSSTSIAFLSTRLQQYIRLPGKTATLSNIMELQKSMVHGIA